MNKTLIVLAGIALAVVPACSGDDTSAPLDTAGATTIPVTSPATTTKPATTVPATTVPEVVVRMPLTGVPVGSETEIPDRPALVIKVSNAGPTVRPQAGLNNADIVVEEVINDASTRFAAVFHSGGSDLVGPIRSGRAQDPELLMMLDQPLFGYSGANRYATRVIRNSGMIDVGVDRAEGYYRRQGAGKRAPNNLYNDTTTLWQYSDKTAGRPTEIFTFVDSPEEIPGSPATQIDLKLDSVRAMWKYDAETDMYYRYHAGEPHSTENGSVVEQISAKNIVVMVADYSRSEDGNPFAHVIGTNTAYVFSHGTVQVGTWNRDEVTAGLNLTDSSGTPLVVQVGRSWIEVPRNIEGTVAYS